MCVCTFRECTWYAEHVGPETFVAERALHSTCVCKFCECTWCAEHVGSQIFGGGGACSAEQSALYTHPPVGIALAVGTGVDLLRWGPQEQDG